MKIRITIKKKVKKEKKSYSIEIWQTTTVDLCREFTQQQLFHHHLRAGTTADKFMPLNALTLVVGASEPRGTLIHRVPKRNVNHTEPLLQRFFQF